MIKFVHFSGFKGGSGKTTLAIHFASFLHNVKKLKVLIIGFDPQSELRILGKNSAFPVFDIRTKSVSEFQRLLNEFELYEYAIVDFPTAISPDLWKLHLNAALIVVPTDTKMMDVLKLNLFVEFAIGSEVRKENICILPNLKISDERTGISERLKLLARPGWELNLAPVVQHGRIVKELNFETFDRRMLYWCRTAFTHILSLIKSSD